VCGVYKTRKYHTFKLPYAQAYANGMNNKCEANGIPVP